MNNRNIVIGIVALLLAGGGYYWYTAQNTVFTIDSHDEISSWDFQGSHNDDGDNEKRVTDEIDRLEDGLDDDATEPPDYQLYVGLAGQYMLLGDGETAYKNLQKALEIDSTTTGLAWHNMGVLMERLGAINSARTAYQKAVDAQPEAESYHAALISFLIKHDTENGEVIQAAFARAESQFQQNAFVYQAKAQWLEAQGMISDAISAWEIFRANSPADMKASIDLHIEQLKKKL